MRRLSSVARRLVHSRRAVWGGALVFALGLPLLLDGFWLFIAASTMSLAIYGAAYDLSYGFTGLLSFGHAVFFGTGAYAAAIAVRDVGAGPIVALAIAMVGAALIAVALGTIAVRSTDNGFVILTIIFVLIANLLAVSWSSVTGGTDGFTVLMPALSLGGLLEVSLSEPLRRYYFVLLLLALTVYGLRRLVRSPVGLTFRMIRDNERRAEMLGYDTTKYKLASLGVSGAFSGLAGALDMFVIGYINTSNFSLMVSADPLVFTLLGGRGTIIGPVIGAVLVDVAAEFVSDATNAYPLFIGALLVVVVVVEREGLLGGLERLRARFGSETEPREGGRS